MNGDAGDREIDLRAKSTIHSTERKLYVRAFHPRNEAHHNPGGFLNKPCTDLLDEERRALNDDHRRDADAPVLANRLDELSIGLVGLREPESTRI
jgi:hypothetical protein